MLLADRPCVEGCSRCWVRMRSRKQGDDGLTPANRDRERALAALFDSVRIIHAALVLSDGWDHLTPQLQRKIVRTSRRAAALRVRKERR